MWGYEYEEQQKKKRRQAVPRIILLVILVGVAGWLYSGYFSVSGPDRQLLSAVRGGDAGAVSLAIHNGASPNATYRDGHTVLHEAAWNGESRIVRSLIRAGADANARVPGTEETPLHYAVRANRPDMVILLMSAGARTSLRTLDVSKPDIRGNRHPAGLTPREMAEAAEFEEVIQAFRGG